MISDKDMRRSARLLKVWADAIASDHRDSTDQVSMAAMSEAKEMHELSNKLYAEARNRRLAKSAELAP